MDIFEKHKKLQQVNSSTEDKFEVVLKTEKNFSEEEKKAIILTVKNGIMSGLGNRAIAMRLIIQFELSDMVILNRMKDGIEVII